MKKSYKTMLGVTLLEIMLVLAIAALVIIMSIKFYQSASNSSKLNAALSQIQAIMSAAENFNVAHGGSYVGMATADCGGFMPGGVMPLSPWGKTEECSGTTASQYTITINDIPGGSGGTPSNPGNSVCNQLAALSKQNERVSTAVCSSGTLVITVLAYGAAT